MSDLMTFGVGIGIFICAFGIGYFTKRDKLENELEIKVETLENELEIEVELNVKLLKENETLAIRCELLVDRNDALVEHHYSHHSELSASRADSFPAQESTSAIPGNSFRAGGNSSTTCCCVFCYCNEKTDLVNSDNNVCDSCIRGLHTIGRKS